MYNVTFATGILEIAQLYANDSVIGHFLLHNKTNEHSSV